MTRSLRRKPNASDLTGRLIELGSILIAEYSRAVGASQRYAELTRTVYPTSRLAGKVITPRAIFREFYSGDLGQCRCRPVQRSRSTLRSVGRSSPLGAPRESISMTKRILPFAVMTGLLTLWVPNAAGRSTCPVCAKGQTCQCIATCLPPLPCKGSGQSCSCKASPISPKAPQNSISSKSTSSSSARSSAPAAGVRPTLPSKTGRGSR